MHWLMLCLPAWQEAKKVEAAAAATGGAASTIPHGNVPTAKDEDPDGSKLLAVELPIEEAQKHVVRLAAGGSKSPQCLQLVCDVALRRKKYVQAIKAVNQALAIDRSHPAVFTALSNTLSAACTPALQCDVSSRVCDDDCLYCTSVFGLWWTRISQGIVRQHG
jgi:predicted Zn-dependent protease